jgi:hypothetical protein
MPKTEFSCVNNFPTESLVDYYYGALTLSYNLEVMRVQVSAGMIIRSSAESLIMVQVLRLVMQSLDYDYH